VRDPHTQTQAAAAVDAAVADDPQVQAALRQDALDQLLTLAGQLLTKNVAVTEGRPTSLDIGGTIVPGYDLMVEMQVQTA
jgi:hypothetical protein